MSMNTLPPFCDNLRMRPVRARYRAPVQALSHDSRPREESRSAPARIPNSPYPHLFQRARASRYGIEIRELLEESVVSDASLVREVLAILPDSPRKIKGDGAQPGVCELLGDIGKE